MRKTVDNFLKFKVVYQYIFVFAVSYVLITSKVIIEVKAVEAVAPVHFAQLLTYLKLSGIKLGLLINFNSKTLTDNIHRVVNNL